MLNDTLTLALDGEVSLGDYSKILNGFNTFINKLSQEVSSGAKINWVITELSAGSAMATVQGVYEDAQLIENVVVAYENIGEVLQGGGKFPYSRSIENLVFDITKVIDGKITGIRLETQNNDYYITSSVKMGVVAKRLKYSIGSVKGMVETLSMRNQLQFTLFDSIFDKAVRCYLEKGQEDNMRDVWGKRAIVYGRVARNPENGLPVNIRGITDIQIIPPVDPNSYKQARGVFHWKEGDKKAEDIIGGIRNGR